MLKARIPQDVMTTRMDISLDSLPTIGFLELRNIGHARIRDSKGKIF